MSAIPRILDANLNRAREACRLMEDAARFAINDGKLCGELKSIRHDLREAIDDLPLPAGVLEANRDTTGDVGTGISTQSETTRGGLLDIVIAAGKRLGESLRVIEEMCKTLDAEVASQIESLRYRAYVVEQQLHLRLGSGRAKQWRLCLLLTRSLCERPWREVLRESIAGGVDCVQVREKDMDGGDLCRHVRDVIDLAKSVALVTVIVNDRVDVALAAGADGVHLGQNDLTIHEARKIAGRNLLIGASTHDLDEARTAVEAGADYCGVGAMFATSLKPEREPSGPRYLQSFIMRFPVTPHLAIGGITPANIHQLVQAGVRGVAVSTAICAADDHGAVARSMRDAIEVGKLSLNADR